MQTPPPTLAHIWQTLWRRKWKVVGVWAWRTLGCLCSDLHQISRGYQQMAGVRWGWGVGGSWGCEKMRDKDVRRQARVWGVAANKNSHMAQTQQHAVKLCVRCFCAAFMTAICSYVIWFEWWGSNTGINFRDEGKMLTSHNGGILGADVQHWGNCYT